ncbi:MAG: hypothetical protein EAZ77_12955 [Nostocales cyanobacterium]|nr:MAG: hypothetical protein EAZ77_12955 [Nostocales cyanobacterium]
MFLTEQQPMRQKARTSAQKCKSGYCTQTGLNNGKLQKNCDQSLTINAFITASVIVGVSARIVSGCRKLVAL